MNFALRQVYALVHDNIVKNRFECDNYELANQLARAAFDGAIAVNTDRFATSIGDKYINGVFLTLKGNKEDGTEEYVECQYIPTEWDEINELQHKLLQSQLVLTDTYEEKLALENKLVALQQTITEIYEKIGG